MSAFLQIDAFTYLLDHDLEIRGFGQGGHQVEESTDKHLGKVDHRPPGKQTRDGFY
jgi:hypothetical protein